MKLLSKILHELDYNKIIGNTNITISSIQLDSNHVISSSLFEGNPKTILEAMSMGCIVIASDIKNHRELIEKWYIALEQGDFETIYNMHHDDVVYNMLGNTPVSGRIYGKDACCNGMIGEKLLEKLVSDKVQF